MFKISQSPIKLNNITIRNRTVSSPVSINMANTDGTVTKNIISYFSNFWKRLQSPLTFGNYLEFPAIPKEFCENIGENNRFWRLEATLNSRVGIRPQYQSSFENMDVRLQ